MTQHSALEPQHWLCLQQGAVIQVSGLVGQGTEAILEYGLACLGGTGAFVARIVQGTDAEIVGLA